MLAEGQLGRPAQSKGTPRTFTILIVRFTHSQVDNDADTSNFDTFAEDDAPEPDDDLTGWDKEF